MLFYTYKVFPSTLLDQSSIKFEFGTDHNIYLYMLDTQLSLNLQPFKGRFSGTLKKSLNIMQNQRMTQMRNKKPN